MRACPRCNASEIEFNERYRVDGETIPAWFCESPRCGYVEFVRARKRHTSKTRQASATSPQGRARLDAAHASTEPSKKPVKPAASRVVTIVAPERRRYDRREKGNGE